MTPPQRPPIEELLEDIKEDHLNDLEPYLAIALVPLQVMISDEKFPTDKAKRAMIKQSLEEMGFAGALVQSVEPVPVKKH